MSFLLNVIGEHDIFMNMKKLFVLIFCVLMGCKDQNSSRTIGNGDRFASTSENHYTVTLRCDQKLLNATFDHYAGIGYLTRNMRTEEFPETYAFATSMFHESYGTYRIVESKCLPRPTSNNCSNTN
jgi:hypothetical protein